MEDRESTNVELASIYRLTATSFRLSAELLEKGFGEKAEQMPYNYRSMPFYFLISHACELLLKSALLKRGFAEEQLRQYDLRHNLLSLLECLESKGVKISQSSTAIVRGLSRQHSDHELRYTALLDNGEATYTPEPRDIFGMLDELMLATRLSFRDGTLSPCHGPGSPGTMGPEGTSQL
jgi:hypothetical protein